MLSLPGTIYVAKPGDSEIGKLNGNYPITTSWILKSDLSVHDANSFASTLNTYCKSHNLIVTSHIDSHHLCVSGIAKDYEEAFRMFLYSYQNADGDMFHGSDTPINVPIAWENKVHHVIGFNNIKFRRVRSRQKSELKAMNITSESEAAPISNNGAYYSPLQLASIYNFPTKSNSVTLDGSGITIGILEFGGGYNMSDITRYLTQLGITATPKIVNVSVSDGNTVGSNNPSDTADSVDVVLDIEIVCAIVPNANIRVYFAPNTNGGMYYAYYDAVVRDKCDIVSTSWGAYEYEFASSGLTPLMNSISSILNSNSTVVAASGDEGSTGDLSNISSLPKPIPQYNVLFPASSPYVLACGGTKVISSDGINFGSEIVWNNGVVNGSDYATGGGVSMTFTTPSYQSTLPTNIKNTLNGRRGLPDIAAHADPSNGYLIYGSNFGTAAGWYVIGGTSAAASLWAGLLARIYQATGKKYGVINSTLYDISSSSYHNITTGNNGNTANPLYAAGTGWNFCTGWGSPNGVNLMNALIAASSAISTTTKPTTTVRPTTTRPPPTTRAPLITKPTTRPPTTTTVRPRVRNNTIQSSLIDNPKSGGSSGRSMYSLLRLGKRTM